MHRMRSIEPKTYVVEGSKYGEFPLDMLRHDDAKAASEADQNLIEDINNFMGDKDHLPKKVRVTLTTDSRFAPNTKRWESFGYRVVECSDPTIELSKPPPQVKFDTALKGVEADYHEALATLTPKQAWAFKIAMEVQRGLTERVEKIAPHEARKIGAGEGIAAYVARNRQEVLDGLLKQQALVAQRRPKDTESFLRHAREQIIEEYGHGAKETFMIGDVVYATVRVRHMVQFHAVVDGDRVEKVFR